MLLQAATSRVATVVEATAAAKVRLASPLSALSPKVALGITQPR